MDILGSFVNMFKNWCGWEEGVEVTWGGTFKGEGLKEGLNIIK